MCGDNLTDLVEVQTVQCDQQRPLQGHFSSLLNTFLTPAPVPAAHYAPPNFQNKTQCRRGFVTFAYLNFLPNIFYPYTTRGVHGVCVRVVPTSGYPFIALPSVPTNPPSLPSVHPKWTLPNLALLGSPPAITPFGKGRWSPT